VTLSSRADLRQLKCASGRHVDKELPASDLRLSLKLRSGERECNVDRLRRGPCA
jgi:hypothetical protein